MTQLNPNISTAFTDLVNKTGTSSSLEVRVGYLGMCMRESGEEWLCSRSAEDLANIIRENNTEEEAAGHDPLNLIWMAKDFTSQSVFSGLIFATISVRQLKYCVVAILAVASLLALVSVLWQHIVSSSALAMGHSLSYGAIGGNIGTVAIVLGWGGVLVDALSVMAIISQLVWSSVLDRLLREEEEEDDNDDNRPY
ncbi:hypothetical protein FQN54_002417 [Arachnomyces sp. PD_36]|nr:hypothetical protein FQN54_002417 [Arachnomyces sp. PD_36]